MTEYFTLLYVSQASPDFEPMPGIDGIVTQSVSWNRSVRITGALIYTAGFFSQYLEGPEQAVCELVERIKADPRHSGLSVLQRSARPKRLFPRWSLAYAGNVSFVSNQISRLFDRTRGRGHRSVDAAATHVIRLMNEFIKVREALSPTLH